MLRAYQTLSGATGMLVLIVNLVVVAGPSAAERPSSLPTTKCMAGEAVHTVGQKIYVPAYSHIYYQNQKRRYPLAVTLSIRNTDEQHTLSYIDTVRGDRRPASQGIRRDANTPGAAGVDRVLCGRAR